VGDISHTRDNIACMTGSAMNLQLLHDCRYDSWEPGKNIKALSLITGPDLRESSM